MSAISLHTGLPVCRAAMSQVAQGFERCGLDAVASSYREHEAMAAQIRGRVSAQYHVCSRIVGIWIHGIRAVQFSGGGETNVVCFERGNYGHVSPSRPPSRKNGAQSPRTRLS